MKKIISLIALMLTHISSWACEVCKKQQPKVLAGITHGAGSQSDWDYVIVGITMLIVVISLVYSIKWIVCPGEQAKEHIKRSIFNTAQL